MPYPVYKILHFLGMFLVFVALAGLCARAAFAAPGDRTAGDAPRGAVRGRRLLLALHGSGLFLVLLGGFGMMSRLGIPHTALFPGWIWVKLGIWTAAAGLVAVPKWRPGWALALLALLPFLGALAGAVALYKPFR